MKNEYSFSMTKRICIHIFNRFNTRLYFITLYSDKYSVLLECTFVLVNMFYNPRGIWFSLLQNKNCSLWFFFRLLFTNRTFHAIVEKFCCHISNNSNRGLDWQKDVWHGSAYEANVGTEFLHAEKRVPIDINWHLLNAPRDRPVDVSTVKG